MQDMRLFQDSEGYFGHTPLVNFLRPEKTLFTWWTNFLRHPKKIMKEQFICVAKGKEHFKLASPIFTQCLYVNAQPEFKRGVSPLNFFDINRNKYPLAL